MKLYYKAGACSLAPHIILREAGENFEIEAVDLPTKKTASGADFVAINPKGYIPALQLDDGSLLTEGAAISLYVAEKNPAAGLLPTDALGRARVTEMLLFIATELHKSFSPLFNPTYDAAAKATAKGLLTRRLDFAEKLLADGREYLVGGAFTPADAYLFTVLGWTGAVGIDLASFANLSAFRARIAARPAVQAALKAEGLI